MPVIDAKTIEKTAHLSSLKLSEEEKVLYSKQIGDIISYVEKLSELDTSDVKPTDHITDIYNVTREDKPIPSMDRKAIEEMAPSFENGHFVVPRIIEA